MWFFDIIFTTTEVPVMTVEIYGKLWLTIKLSNNNSF